jgi:acetoin:2,6-dichlorophenolindophenol oxidoreductase subunit alpha
MAEQVSAEVARDFLNRMLLIRRAEEQVMHFAQDYQGLIRGHYHVYIGQEAMGVGVCAALRQDDYVFTTHRNHGHIVARGGDPGPLLAEILGRTTGYNKGRGGTFHVAPRHLGFLQTSAVVGGCLPLATGAAFSIKQLGEERVSLVFFGDGVLEEGAFYEAINLAKLWTLPIVFLCENNSVPPELRAAGQFPSSTHSAKQLVDVPRAFDIPADVVDGADVEAVHEAARAAVDRTRRGDGPTFLEVRASRWPGNFGVFPESIGGDYQLRWIWQPDSAPESLRDWLERSDPVALYARALVEQGVLTNADIEEIDAQAQRQAADAARFALESPQPDAARALEYVLP